MSRTMCGRYTYKLTWSEIVKLYRLTLPDEEPPGLKPSYNVAPTDVMPIIRPAGNGRELLMAGWGLVPFSTRERTGSAPRRPIASHSSRDAAWCRRLAGTNGKRSAPR